MVEEASGHSFRLSKYGCAEGIIQPGENVRAVDSPDAAAVHVVQHTLGHASLAATTRYVHVQPGESSGHSLAKLGARL